MAKPVQMYTETTGNIVANFLLGFDKSYYLSKCVSGAFKSSILIKGKEAR